MFKPILPKLAEKIRNTTSVIFIPEIHPLSRIILKSDDTEAETTTLGKCYLKSNKSLMFFEHVCIDPDFLTYPNPKITVDMYTALKFVLLDMLVVKAEEMANRLKKRKLHITTDLDMMPEILLDHGFKLYPASMINCDDFLGIKELTNERRTNYGFNYLTRLKKSQTSGSKDKEEPRKNRQMGFLYRAD